jgi:hypothetical protein
MNDSQSAEEYRQLVEQLHDPQTQRTARRELVAAGAVEPLLQCLGSDSESVVWAAVESLGELRARQAVGPLIDLLQRGVLLLDVCEALTMITGQYFGTNVSRWREWLEGPPPPSSTPPSSTPPSSTLPSSTPAKSTPSSSPGLDVADCVRRTGQFIGVQPAGSGKSYRFKLSLPKGRMQQVAVFFGRKDAKGDDLVVIYSECGPANPKFYETVLRKNMGIPAGAFAIRDIKGRPNFVMVDTMVAASVTPSALAKNIENIASWADMVEKDLAKEDRR